MTLDQGKVVSITAYFAEPATVSDARGKFVIGAADPVEVTDERGQALGLAFPEQGVLFAYAGGGKSVSQMLFDPIDPESFLLRAKRDQSRAPNGPWPIFSSY